VILQVGYSARSPYEYSHHVKIGREFRVTDDDIHAIERESAGQTTALPPLTRAALRAARELTAQPNLSEETRLFWRIAQHAGSEILPGLSSRLLVATHVFLESIHYFVWILLIPLVDRRAIPWRLRDIPLLENANGIPKIFIGFCVFGLLAVIALWFGFAVDYTTTRDIYFAFAIGHVLAEFPFLIKML